MLTNVILDVLRHVVFSFTAYSCSTYIGGSRDEKDASLGLCKYGRPTDSHIHIANVRNFKRH